VTWTSPRKDAENAKAVGERIAGDYEQHLGRPLTAEELADIHTEARRVTAGWGCHARRVADRERELGRPLTPAEMAGMVRESLREVVGDDAEEGK
jgi:hypothetical protein